MPKHYVTRLAAALRTGRGAERLYDEYGTGLFGYCWSMLGDATEAAGALTDTVLVATAHADALADPADLTSWVFALARNECLRRRPDAPPAASPYACAPDADVLTMLVARALTDLRPADRELLDLTIRHRMSAPQLALVLDMAADEAAGAAEIAVTRFDQTLSTLFMASSGRLAVPHDLVADRPPLRVLLDLLPSPHPPADLRGNAAAACVDPELDHYRLMVARRALPLGEGGFPRRLDTPARGDTAGAHTGLPTAPRTGAGTGPRTGVPTAPRTGVPTGSRTGAGTGSHTGVPTGSRTGPGAGVPQGAPALGGRPPGAVPPHGSGYPPGGAPPRASGYPPGAAAPRTSGYPPEPGPAYGTRAVPLGAPVAGAAEHAPERTTGPAIEPVDPDIIPPEAIHRARASSPVHGARASSPGPEAVRDARASSPGPEAEAAREAAAHEARATREAAGRERPRSRARSPRVRRRTVAQRFWYVTAVLLAMLAVAGGAWAAEQVFAPPSSGARAAPTLTRGGAAPAVTAARSSHRHARTHSRTPTPTGPYATPTPRTPSPRTTPSPHPDEVPPATLVPSRPPRTQPPTTHHPSHTPPKSHTPSPSLTPTSPGAD